MLCFEDGDLMGTGVIFGGEHFKDQRVHSSFHLPAVQKYIAFPP